jgi:hypothetical protein
VDTRHDGDGDGNRRSRLGRLLRETNDKLVQFAEVDDPADLRHLVCECGECAERMAVTLAEYRRARESHGLLVVAGHEDGRHVVWQADEVSLVEELDGRVAL